MEDVEFNKSLDDILFNEDSPMTLSRALSNSASRLERTFTKPEISETPEIKEDPIYRGEQPQEDPILSMLSSASRVVRYELPIRKALAGVAALVVLGFGYNYAEENFNPGKHFGAAKLLSYKLNMNSAGSFNVEDLDSGVRIHYRQPSMGEDPKCNYYFILDNAYERNFWVVDVEDTSKHSEACNDHILTRYTSRFENLGISRDELSHALRNSVN